MGDDVAGLGDRMHELMERSPIATAVFAGPEQRITLSNLRFDQLFDLGGTGISTFSEWLSRVVPGADERAQLVSEWRAQRGSIEGSAPAAKPLQAEFVCANGSRRPMKIFISAVGESSLISLVDASDEVRISAALRTNERRLRAIFESAPGFMGVLSVDGLLVDANTTALSFAGVEAAEVAGKPFWDTPWWTHSTELQEQLRAAVARAATGEAAYFEATHRSAEDGLHQVEFRLSPVTDETGQVVALIARGRDVTDYRRAEMELAEIIDFLPDATFVIDREKRVVAWNRAMEEMTGVSKAMILGRGDDAYSVPFYGERRPVVADLVWSKGADSHLYSFVEWRGDTVLAQAYAPALYGGRGAHLWIAASLLRDSEGNPSGAIESVRDITERIQAEEALRAEEERIRKAYIDVIDAVTGGKLILLTEEALASELGRPLGEIIPIASPADRASARRRLIGVTEARLPARTTAAPRVNAVGEAWNNALKHAGGGTCQSYTRDARLQVAVIDRGPGIDFRTLPKATLVPGFSTAATLGVGFTIMLQLCERVLLCTRPGFTEVVLEVSAKP
jgi:PAS domain S-box-containing protein